MNEHDSENISGMLESMGIKEAETPEEANIVVMNTCSVREHADKRFFGMLGQFKKKKEEDPYFIMCVCGCMPQQPRIVKEIKESFGWTDIVFGTQTISQFPQLLRKRIETGVKQLSIIENSSEIPEEDNAKRLHKHKALVNITYGCNNFCTYCIVPYTRGREKSRTIAEVTEEVRRLADDGVIEVMLLGQNVNSFMDPSGGDFADLIREINGIPGIRRIRFMTSHPKDISPKLIDCYRDCGKLCHQIHLPVQSGSDRILKRMNRHYDREKYLSIVASLREACPDIAISTDIIVGFPGETEEDFKDTLSLVDQVQYDSAFTFIYSRREGTPAAVFKDQVPEDVKHRRLIELNEHINQSALRKNQKYIGRIEEVLCEGRSSRNDMAWTGRTDDFKLVNFTGGRDTTGQIVKVKITDAKTFSLDGTLA